MSEMEKWQQVRKLIESMRDASIGSAAREMWDQLLRDHDQARPQKTQAVA